MLLFPFDFVCRSVDFYVCVLFFFLYLIVKYFWIFYNFELFSTPNKILLSELCKYKQLAHKNSVQDHRLG